MNNHSPLISKALYNRSLFTESLFSRPESLSKLLPYEEFIETDKIFQMKDGSLGAVFEIELLEHETMSEKQILKAVENTKSWFSLPTNCVLQILFDQSYLSPLDKDLKKIEDGYKNSHPVSNFLFDDKIKSIKKTCKNPSQKTPLKRRTYLSIRYFPQNKASFKKKAHKIKEYFKHPNSTLMFELKGFIREYKNFRHIVKNISQSSEIKLKLLGAEELLDFLRKFFNPKTYYKRDFCKFNSSLSLSDQFLFHSPILNYKGIEREGVKTRTITLKTSPLYAFSGEMAYFSQLTFPFKISLNFSFPSKGKIKKYFGLKEFFLENTLSARGQVQKEEVKHIQERLARDDRCLQMTFSVIVEGKTTEELEDRVREICNIFHNKLECEVIEEDHIGLGLCLNSLPLNYTPDSDYSTQRAIKVLKSDALKFVPIFDSFRGLKNPLSLFLSRENNLVPFSLTENETSNHTVVLADTGSGKSALVGSLLQASKRQEVEPIVFIIDKKSSYSMLSEYYEGDLTIFKRDGDIPFSPFRGVYDEEKIAFLTKLIVLSIKLTSPSFILESEHQSAISCALKNAYLKKSNQQGLSYVDGKLIKQDTHEEVELSMEDVVIELGALIDTGKNNIKKIVEPLISKLRPFYGDGIYKKFFSPSPVKKKHKNNPKNKLLYIYDLDALDGDEVLQTLMTLSVIEEIRRILSLPQNEGRPSFLVMEEFSMLGRKNPAFRDFAIDFSETMRKRGCWLITLTPKPQNYFDLEVGKAFWGVADNFIFLQMSTDNVDFISKNSSLIDEASKEIINSLKTVNGEYADVFYMNKKKTKMGAFRYIQTPSEKWMSPTNAKDLKAALHALKTHESKWEALEYLTKKYPKGVR